VAFISILNQSGDITANNNLNLTAKTLTNIANQQTTTQKRDTTTTIGKASNLKGKNININAKDVRNTASNITAQDLTITANNLNITTQQNTTDLKAIRLIQASIITCLNVNVFGTIQTQLLLCFYIRAGDVDILFGGF
jgi:hypothetical protein